ncbi:hypothetical protein AURDEDRAFT_112473 [Auricularia subglabra TFB-10046 SS5]|nr:hypothetical protein AURDEDRAFT_112473 [Auricularia subglabra TFB-10046 SS5]
MSANVFISTFAPFPTYALSVPSETLISAVPALLAEREPRLPLDQLRLSHPSVQLRPTTRLWSLGPEGGFVTLRLAPAVRGGKGGFGSQLRAAGGRMSSRKTGNTDSCRDLSGRRLSTLKEAQKLATYMEAEPDRKKAAADARKAKLAALEKQLGIDPKNPNAQTDAEPQVGQKRRFEDTKFLEETQELVEGVRDAVAAGLLKKRKKAKTDAAAKAAGTPSSSSSTEAITKAVVESAATAPVVAAASVAVGIASA